MEAAHNFGGSSDSLLKNVIFCLFFVKFVSIGYRFGNDINNHLLRMKGPQDNIKDTTKKFWSMRQ